MSPVTRRVQLPPIRPFVLEEPGNTLLFDADRGLPEEATARYSVKALVQSLSPDLAAAQKLCREFGQGAMKLTIELADGKYQDRTGEMIERVYLKTGVSFPHRMQRYAELFLIAVRPLDRWNVTCATPEKLVIEVSGCAVFQALKERGLFVAAHPEPVEGRAARGLTSSPRAGAQPSLVEGLPCLELCQGGFRVAAEKTGDKLRMDVPKTLPKDGRCQFVFTRG